MKWEEHLEFYRTSPHCGDRFMFWACETSKYSLGHVWEKYMMEAGTCWNTAINSDEVSAMVSDSSDARVALCRSIVMEWYNTLSHHEILALDYWPEWLVE